MTPFAKEVRRLVDELDVGGMNAVHGVIAQMKAAGAVRNIHVGDMVHLDPVQTVEWYAGQVLDVLESKSCFAVNSIINTLDKFVPEDS